MADKEPVGARLKKIRLGKGISLEQCHKATKIHVELLKAIEEDNYIDLDPVYLKGFLKIYCRYLGEQLPEETGVKRQPPEPPAQVQEKKAAIYVQDTGYKLMPALVAAAMILFAAILLFAAGKTVISAVKNNKPRIARIDKERISAGKKQERSGKKAVKAGQIVQDESLRLGARALEDCWVLLKADNKVVFQNILKKGRFESWNAQERMELTLGNAGGVQLEINGKIIPSLGKRGQVLKDIVITRKEGLKVGK